MTEGNATVSRPILVVDDEQEIRCLLREFLTDEGYEVVTAPNGRAALEVATSLSPAVILLDMNMPVMDGWAFARAYRNQVKNPVPVIILTAGGSAAQRAAEVEATGFLPKPFDIDELLAIVDHLAPVARQGAGGDDNLPG